MKNTTKTLFMLTALAVSTAACTSGEKTNKADELEKLRAERDKLDKSISVLEEELAKSDTTKGGGGSKKISLVTVEEVQPTTFNHFLDIQGKVDSDNNVMISAKIAGTLTNVFVKEGDHVSAGQLLAKIDAETTERSLAEVKNSLELASTVYERQKALWDQQIGTEVQYLQAKNNKEALDRKIETLNAQLDQSRIKAPISGTIDKVLFKQGESVVPGAVFRLVNLSAFKMVAEVPETYSARVNQGDEVSIFFPDLNKTIKGRLSTVSNVINPLTRTFTVEIRLGNPSGFLLKPNMLARLQIKDYSSPKAIVVPINTVQSGTEGKYVFVAEGTKATRRTVTVGQTYGSTAEIKSGLKPGDKIVSVGYQDLEEGQNLKF